MKNNYLIICLLLVIIMGCSVKGEKTNENRQYRTVTCAPAPLQPDNELYESSEKAPLFDNLGNYDYKVTTDKELAQKYFNQGLILAYGFNHPEAARSFNYASELDPDCAMAYWGYAYVLGPNYNSAMSPDNYPKAYDAIQKAVQLSKQVTPKEKALINAMALRYVPEEPEDRTYLDEAYAGEMKRLFEAYPGDADIGTLYAEAQMNLHPWDLYDKNGNPKEWTPPILEALEKATSVSPEHPGAHHFYIHAVEASKDPGQGLHSAELYDEGLVPGAGHLVHMPSHIYIRTGDYHKGTVSNINAVKADSIYTSVCHAQGVYPLTYYPHNYHFLAATATLEGNKEWGVLGAQKVAEHSNRELMTEPGWGTLQHYYSIPYYVYVKFGMWEEILKRAKEDPELKYPGAVRAYARGMAFLGKEKIGKAEKELQKLVNYSKDNSLQEITVWDINSVHDLILIAVKVLDAEIASSQKEYVRAIALLTEAVEMEDKLNYNEPPDWFFSVRHNLGAVQIEAGRYDDALKTYKADLLKFPKNGWALHGMKQAYTHLDQKDRARKVDQALAEVWATADIEISGSRIK